MASGARLHDEVVNGIMRLMREDGLARGDRIVESRLAERLRVSRTPVRAALDQLAKKGYIRRVYNRGVELIRLPEEAPAGENNGEEHGLVVQICRDRNLGQLGDDVTETEMMRRYDISRSETGRVLEQLAALGVAERKLGYGWRFLDSLRDRQARIESFQFRMLIEPQAILQPDFALPKGWAEEMRQRHNSFRQGEWNSGSSIAFFDMNAAFHLGIATASGNRYIADAVIRQNHLRRLLNYDWHHGRSRVEIVCDEHLEILDRIESGDNQIASLLMYRHIEKTMELQPPFANGG